VRKAQDIEDKHVASLNGPRKGNSNRAKLAVARKVIAHQLAVDRENREFMFPEPTP
jgi:hypothetical protein